MLLLWLLQRLVPRLLLLQLWLALVLRLVPWLWLLVLRLLVLRGRWPWPLLPVGSGGEGVWRLGLGHWLALLRLLRLRLGCARSTRNSPSTRCRCRSGGSAERSFLR